MKTLRLMMMGLALVGLLTACGGAPKEEAAPAEEAQVVEPTPVFEDDFESGEAEGWAEDKAPEGEEVLSDAEEEDQG